VLDQLTPELPRRAQRLPNQRWQIYPAQTELATQLAEATQLSPIVSQLLVNRGIETLQQAQAFIEPESQVLPSPLEEFPDLAYSVELLQDAIASQHKIAICGDYDADGMTSTALLLRSLRWLGAQVDYAIPSRMHEGYGINQRIVEEFHREGVQLILTVDNGISAFEPIARARELGLKVIVTDHHDIPQRLPPADAILNPKLIPESSPYRGVAGVGVAYILAVSLAQQLGQIKGLVKPLLELFTLGTIADLAPLTGVNRRWVKRGLRQLPQSQLAGVQALIQVAGVQGSRGAEEQDKQNSNPKSKIQNPKSLKPDDIGFRLGPRINAVGRLADPQIVIELLTTDDMGLALERAMQCEQINQHRQQLCEQIEQEVIAYFEQSQLDLQQERVLLIVQPNWHHGVIGIVASRLVERYGVPVFIGTYEDEHHIRGSARGIPEFHVFEALEFCQDLLGKFGGHKAAGGFSLPAENLDALRSRLSQFANRMLKPEHLKPLIKIDAQANLNQIDLQLYKQLDALHPCGIENPDPLFWTPNVQVVEQQIVGKGHIKLTLAQDNGTQPVKIKAIAWRWRDYFPLPPRVDLAYRLRENTWNGSTTIELELLGVRLPGDSSPGTISHPLFQSTGLSLKAQFYHKQRRYTCGIFQSDSSPELRIRNSQGQVLAIQPGESTGFLGTKREDAKEVDLSQPFHNLIQAAFNALETVEKTTSNLQKHQPEQKIDVVNQQLTLLNQQLGQLSTEQQQQIQVLKSAIEERENHIALLQSQLNQPVHLLELAQIEKSLKLKLGDAVWNQLQPLTQKDLCFAWKHYGTSRSQGVDAQIADYSEAGLRLSFAIEREIIQPFFTHFYEFLLTPPRGNGWGNTTFEVGGMALKAKGKYTLGCLPALLSTQWETFRDNILKQATPMPAEELYYTVFFGNQVSQVDRHLIAGFLQQWQHPLSQWLATGEAAASVIDQINKLRNIAAHAEHFLYEWQFKVLRLLIVGNKTRQGVLQDIYQQRGDEGVMR